MKLSPSIEVACHPICLSEFSVFLSDPEQKAEMDLFLHYLTNSVQLLDVGSHWGSFTLAALISKGQSARSICIEASADAASVLKTNLMLNGLNHHVEVVNAACGPCVGRLKMLTTGAGGADYFVVPQDDRSDTISVPQVSIDSVCSNKSYAPTHVKIDVEGFEEEVLTGAGESLRRHRPVVFLELHGDLIRRRGKDALTVLDLLERYGYPNAISVEAGGIVTRDQLSTKEFNARLIFLPQ